MSFESVEVPFKLHGNRRCLTREQIENNEYLADFVKRFPNSFEWSPVMDLAYFIEPELEQDKINGTPTSK